LVWPLALLLESSVTVVTIIDTVITIIDDR
jgi:hypothetical protein